MDYKFYIEYNNILTEVFPVNNNIKIKGNKESWRWREKIDTEIILISTGGYNYLKTLESLNPKLIIIIKIKINDIWVEKVRNYFYLNECEWDNDNCQIKIKSESLDIYNNVLLNSDIKYNILAVPTLNNNVNVNINTPDFEYFETEFDFTYRANEVGRRWQNNTEETCDVYMAYNSDLMGQNFELTSFNTMQISVFPIGSTDLLIRHNPNIPVDLGWQIIDLKIYINISSIQFYQLPNTDVMYGFLWLNQYPVLANAKIKYFRKISKTFDINGVSALPSTPGNWILTDTSLVYGAVLSTYASAPYLTDNFYKWTGWASNFTNGYIDYLGIGVSNQISRYPTNIVFTYNDIWRSLKNTMQFILNSIDGNLLFKSDLLFSNNNPLTGSPNKYYHHTWWSEIIAGVDSVNREIYIAAISDVKQVPQSTEKAWKQLLSFNDLMNDIKTMFNGDWIIIDNELIFESVEYFRNGNKYPLINTTQTIFNVKTNDNKYKNKYSYRKDSLCNFENITIPNNDSLDFIGVDIFYGEYFNTEKQIKKTQTIQNFTTDLANVYNRHENMPNDGFCMSVIETTGIITETNNIPPVVGNVIYQITIFESTAISEIVNYSGKITGAFLTNGLFSVSVLEEIFYKYYRPKINGVLNLLLQNFLSVIPTKTQKNIIYNNCKNDFNPKNRYQTELGTGEVTEYEEIIKQGGSIIMTLTHQN